MTLQPRFETIPAKNLIGQRLTMSLAENKTGELWKNFMPRRREITNPVNSDLVSMQVYDSPAYFQNFDPTRTFEKWAAVEVPEFGTVPDGMETYELPGGLYAVFLHQGAAQTAPATFQFIFGTWLPRSGYVLDDRPHFEILGEKYKNNFPDSEEEIWIPVKLKA